MRLPRGGLSKAQQSLLSLGKARSPGASRGEPHPLGTMPGGDVGHGGGCLPDSQGRGGGSYATFAGLALCPSQLAPQTSPKLQLRVG